MDELTGLTTSDWVPPGAAPRPGTAWRFVWLVPVLVVGAIIWLLTGPLAAVMAAVVVAIALWVWVRIQGRLALRSVDAIPVALGDEPRLANLAVGLAARVGMDPPGLWVIPQGGPNALVCRSPGPAVAVTRSMLDSYARTELEAVVAHCVVRLATAEPLSELTALGPLGSRVAGPVGAWADAAAASLTRYPPAVAAAIAKAEPRTGRFEALWFVAAGGFHDPPRARSAAVADL